MPAKFPKNEIANPALPVGGYESLAVSMKKALITLFVVTGITAQAGQGWRTFTSLDGSRTFKGQLVAYDRGSDTVTVINSKRQRFSFNIETISEDDQDYVDENADKLPPDANLKIRFDELLDKTDSQRGAEKTKTKTYDGGYTIHINSYTPRLISEAEVDYVMIYRKDKVDGNYTDTVIKGSETVEIPPNSSASVETQTVDLVNFYKAGKAVSKAGKCGGGGCSKGSVTFTKSERSRDFMVGCVARVKIDGQVVSVSATSPGILEKYETALDHSK
jgi:hypothetical protein